VHACAGPRCPSAGYAAASVPSQRTPSTAPPRPPPGPADTRRLWLQACRTHAAGLAATLQSPVVAPCTIHHPSLRCGREPLAMPHMALLVLMLAAVLMPTATATSTAPTAPRRGYPCTVLSPSRPHITSPVTNLQPPNPSASSSRHAGRMPPPPPPSGQSSSPRPPPAAPKT